MLPNMKRSFHDRESEMRDEILPLRNYDLHKDLIEFKIMKRQKELQNKLMGADKESNNTRNPSVIRGLNQSSSEPNSGSGP